MCRSTHPVVLITADSGQQRRRRRRVGRQSSYACAPRPHALGSTTTIISSTLDAEARSRRANCSWTRGNYISHAEAVTTDRAPTGRLQTHRDVAPHCQ